MYLLKCTRGGGTVKSETVVAAIKGACRCGAGTLLRQRDVLARDQALKLELINDKQELALTCFH